VGRAIPKASSEHETRQLEPLGLWLPLATAVHNARVNSTTRITPFQAILGYDPNLTGGAIRESANQLTVDRRQEAETFRAQAREALNRTAQSTPEAQYKLGDEVWLEAKHLALPY
jgi:hypothetical protein